MLLICLILFLLNFIFDRYSQLKFYNKKNKVIILIEIGASVFWVFFFFFFFLFNPVLGLVEFSHYLCLFYFFKYQPIFLEKF